MRGAQPRAGSLNVLGGEHEAPGTQLQLLTLEGDEAAVPELLFGDGKHQQHGAMASAAVLPGVAGGDGGYGVGLVGEAQIDISGNVVVEVLEDAGVEGGVGDVLIFYLLVIISERESKSTILLWHRGIMPSTSNNGVRQ